MSVAPKKNAFLLFIRDVRQAAEGETLWDKSIWFRLKTTDCPTPRCDFTDNGGVNDGWTEVSSGPNPATRLVQRLGTPR